MARTHAQPTPSLSQSLAAHRRECVACGGPLWSAYWQERSILTLGGWLRLSLQIRRCTRYGCALFGRPYRPEEEGGYALPHGEIGLDVIASVGAQRFGEHRSVPEIHRALQARQIRVCQRSVTNLLQRYEELVSLHVLDRPRVTERLLAQGRAVLAIDGLQPDVGHEVLWVIRECLSGEVLLARPLLSATESDLAALFREVLQMLPVPVVGVISDGQQSLRKGSPVPCPMCLTRCASSTICARPGTSSSKRIGMSRRSSRNRCVASAPSNANWRDAQMPRQWPRVPIAWPCGARSLTMDARH